MQFSLEMVREVARLLRQADLAEISLEAGADATQPEGIQPARLTLRRAPRAAPRSAPREAPSAASSATQPPALNAEPNASAPDSAEVPLPETPRITVRATAVGLFREATPPCRIGDEVRPGQVVGSVESLRIPTEITAPTAGTIAEVLVQEGQGVEYNQPLVVISQ